MVPAWLSGLGFITDIDFAPYDVDTPLSQLDATFETNGHQSSLAQRLGSRTQTLREVAAQAHAIEPVGTPADVADQLGKIMEEVGGDGFLFVAGPLNRRVVAEITDGLVPSCRRADCREPGTTPLTCGETSRPSDPHRGSVAGATHGWRPRGSGSSAEQPGRPTAVMPA